MSSFFTNLWFLLSNLRFQDVADLILVWIIIYRILILIKKTGTIQILSGLGLLAVFYILSTWFDIFTFHWLLEKFFSNLFVIVVVLFQAEIRRALAQIGSNPFLSDISDLRETHIIEEIVKGAYESAQRGHGALIVLEKEILLDYFIEFGTELNGQVSHQIIHTVFIPSSPVHDGAMLIRSGKIHSVGNFLPLSKNPSLDKNMGTRHRAAIGLTEETDALVIVVSEEQKSIGVALSGTIHSIVEVSELRKYLYQFYGLKSKLESVHEN
jgi:diadenylate cyclase